MPLGEATVRHGVFAMTALKPTVRLVTACEETRYLKPKQREHRMSENSFRLLPHLASQNPLSQELLSLSLFLSLTSSSGWCT